MHKYVIFEKKKINEEGYRRTSENENELIVPFKRGKRRSALEKNITPDFGNLPISSFH